MSIHDKTANIWVLNRGDVESRTGRWIILAFDEQITYSEFYKYIEVLINDVRQEMNLPEDTEIFQVLQKVSNLDADTVIGYEMMSESSSVNHLWSLMQVMFRPDSVIATILNGNNFFEENGSFNIHFSNDPNTDEFEHIIDFGTSFRDEMSKR
jgi:hypothetical protein